MQLTCVPLISIFFHQPRSVCVSPFPRGESTSNITLHFAGGRRRIERRKSNNHQASEPLRPIMPSDAELKAIFKLRPCGTARDYALGSCDRRWAAFALASRAREGASGGPTRESGCETAAAPPRTLPLASRVCTLSFLLLFGSCLTCRMSHGSTWRYPAHV